MTINPSKKGYTTIFLRKDNTCRAGEGISEPLSYILYNMLSDELFKHPATEVESLVLSCR